MVCFLDYVTIQETAKMWGISTRAVTYKVVAGRIPGAFKKGNLWLIPRDSLRPTDGRVNNRRCPKKEARNEPKR